MKTSNWDAQFHPSPTTRPSRAKTRAVIQAEALRWLAVTSLAYVALYGLANHITSLRLDVGEGVFEWERAIPFIGWTIVPYLSICAFFVLSFFVESDRHRLRRHVLRLFIVLVVSIACYAVFPLRFTFQRPLTDGPIGLLFEALHACDLPYNRAPSLHIGVLVVLWVRFAPGVSGGWALCLHGWFALIAASVLTTFQHHVLDVPAGALLGAMAIFLTARPATPAAAWAVLVHASRMPARPHGQPR